VGAARWPGALATPAYRRYAVGALASNVATWALRLSQTLLILQLTGSGAALGLVAGLQFLPLLLAGPWIGVLADRRSKAMLLRTADGAMAVLAALHAVLILTGVITAPLLYVLTFLFGLAAAVDFPLRIALVADILPGEHIANGIALNTVSVNLGRLVGPALAGVLAAEGGLGVSFAVAAVGFAIFAALLTGVESEAVRSTGRVRDGLRYVRGHRELLLVFALVALGGVAGPNILNLAALMATEVFRAGPATVGLYGTLMAVGALVGAVTVVRIGPPTLTAATGGALLLGLVTLAAAAAPGPVSFGALLAAAGAAAMLMVSTSTQLVQVRTDAAIRGRVTSLFSIVLLCGIPIASPPLGVIAELAGARWSIALAGGVVTAAALAVRAVSPR
jgi:predicted MFS family arabinose efflux permease